MFSGLLAVTFSETAKPGHADFIPKILIQLKLSGDDCSRLDHFANIDCYTFCRVFQGIASVSKPFDDFSFRYSLDTAFNSEIDDFLFRYSLDTAFQNYFRLHGSRGYTAARLHGSRVTVLLPLMSTYIHSRWFQR